MVEILPSLANGGESRLGQPSLHTLQVLKGLQAGDRAILSDMKASERQDRVALNTFDGDEITLHPTWQWYVRHEVAQDVVTRNRDN